MRILTVILAGVMAVSAACGTEVDAVDQVNTDETSVASTTETPKDVAPVESSTTTTSTSTTTTTTSTTTSTAAPSDHSVGPEFATIPAETMTAQYWSPSENAGGVPSLRYVLVEPLDFQTATPEELQAVLPFGTPPAVTGIWREWTPEGSNFASGGMLGPIWPVECLGLRPDVDGDLILDDCDPISTDGPLADFDGDGVVNVEDVCPALPNPAQLKGEPFDGLECNPRDDEHLGNAARLLIPRSVTDQNTLRSERGLDPISWPATRVQATGEFADWCALGNEVDEGDFAALRAHMSAMPDMFAMTDADRANFADLLVEITEIFDQLDETSPDPETVANLERVRSELWPLSVMTGSSNVTC